MPIPLKKPHENDVLPVYKKNFDLKIYTEKINLEVQYNWQNCTLWSSSQNNAWVFIFRLTRAEIMELALKPN